MTDKKLKRIHINRETHDHYWFFTEEDIIWELNIPRSSIAVDSDFIDEFEEVSEKYHKYAQKLETLWRLQEGAQVEQPLDLPAFKHPKK